EPTVTKHRRHSRDPGQQLVEQDPCSSYVMASRPDDGRTDGETEVVDGDHALRAGQPVLAVGLMEARPTTPTFGDLAVDHQHRRFRKATVLAPNPPAEHVDDLLPHAPVPPPGEHLPNRVPRPELRGQIPPLA